MNKIKQPKIEANASYVASPEAVGSTDQFSPVFSLEFMDEGHYGLSSCQRDEKAAFADTLRMLSQQTWGELRQNSRKKMGYEQIPRRQIKGRVPVKVPADVEHFIAFRFQGQKPMIGYRAGRTLFLIWLDRDFTLYDHS